jgi:hypothetical protein
MKTIKIIDQVTSDEFEFEDSGDNTIIREFEGFEYPEVRDVIEDISGPQSSIYITSKFGRRRLSFSGDIVGSDVFQTRRDMLAVMRQTGDIKLVEITTYDDLDLQFEAEIVKVVAPYNHKVQKFLIEMVAPDWRLYSQTETENDSSDTNQVITNNGTEASTPVLKIYGSFDDVTITNLSNSESFEISTAVADGHYVEVDCLNRTVKLDGATSMYSDFDGEFFDILPGENTISFNPTNGGVNAKLVTTFRDAYLGL